jgi:DNA primase
MDFTQQQHHWEQLREIDMVEFLAALGYQPEYIKRDTDYWYLSPLRNEGKASFKINRQMNRWYDHGMGKGGNLIDFGILYFKCSIKELLERFDSDLSHFQIPTHEPLAWENKNDEEYKIKIISERELYAYPLIHYLQERNIPLSIATQFCKEVTYDLDGHSYYGIGFKNNAGGFEIRNPYYKCSSSPKDITTIKNGSEEVHIFEGFMDFLSFKTLHQHDVLNTVDYVILNGAAMFERARAVLSAYPVKKLWLDRDTTGIAYTKYALSLQENYQDESKLYANYKDLNDWLKHTGISPKKQLKPKIR